VDGVVTAQGILFRERASAVGKLVVYADPQQLGV
jgi:hypothetical protein